MKPKARPPSKCLSKNVLKMKFMKKSAIETQELIAEEEKNKLIDNEHWYLKPCKSDEEKQNKITVEKSYSIFNSTIFGRLSFQGFNPEIEKIMETNLNGGEKKEEEIISAEDKEFAEYYKNNYHRTTNKKRKNKNNLKNLENTIKKDISLKQLKKKNFIKPNLDD